jgi:PAS domain S-box-containing protein
MPEPKSDSAYVAQWSRLSLRAKGVAALAVPLVALFIVMLSIYRFEGSAPDADQMMMRITDARVETLQFQLLLRNAESAVSGYLATGDSSRLSSFQAARQSAEQSLARLASLAGDGTASAAPFGEIRALAAEGIQTLGQLATGQALPADRNRLLDQAKEQIGQIESRLALLNQAQDLRLLRARYDRDAARRRLFRIAVACGILGPLGSLFVHLIVAGRLVQRLRLVEENARRLAHAVPLEPFDSGSDEIADLARQIEDAAYLLQDRDRELRESERRYRDLFDQAPIPYEETDLDGSIRRYNQAVCTLLQCASEQIMGRHAWDFVAPDQQESFRTAMMERIANGIEAGPFECDYLLQDGSRIAVEIRENFIRNDRGQVTGVCRSLMDVTERNLAAMAARKVKQYALELSNKNEQLARALATARSATEAKSRFLAGISHELRTPLNGIIGFAEIMHDGIVGPVSADHREFLGDILTSARHLLRLINDILDLSKVEAGKMEFQPEPKLIDLLVQEVRDVVRPLADRKNIEMTTDVPPSLSGVIDASRFKQVLYNYLSNAVKFTPPGGHVSLRVTVEEGARFRLEVEDTGIGIEPAEIARLFQEFQQLPNSRTADQGTGLGLALTRHIVEAQGGQVAVRSQPGHGSVFSAVLPLNGLDPHGAHLDDGSASGEAIKQNNGATQPKA